jgi:hypothetical protein
MKRKIELRNTEFSIGIVRNSRLSPINPTACINIAWFKETLWSLGW